MRSRRAVVLEFVPGRASGGMVDALASGASARKGVEVQLLSRARIGSPPRTRRGTIVFGGAETCAKERAVTTIKDSKPCDAVALVVSKP